MCLVVDFVEYPVNTVVYREPHPKFSPVYVQHNSCDMRCARDLFYATNAAVVARVSINFWRAVQPIYIGDRVCFPSHPDLAIPPCCFENGLFPELNAQKALESGGLRPHERTQYGPGCDGQTMGLEWVF